MTGDAYCFVVNPAACRGRAIRRLPAVLGPVSAAGATVAACAALELRS